MSHPCDGNGHKGTRDIPNGTKQPQSLAFARLAMALGVTGFGSAPKAKNICERSWPRDRDPWRKRDPATLTPYPFGRRVRFIAHERVDMTWDRPVIPSDRGDVMLVYLFRDENKRDTFAYSTDVTGRNIPRGSPYTQWSFVAAEKIGDRDDGGEVKRHLKQQGFYVFRGSQRP